jgi:hypothetical protein
MVQDRRGAVTRFIIGRRLTVRSARAKAASIAVLSPTSCTTKQKLSGRSSQTRGASGASAPSVETIAGSGSQLGGVGRLVPRLGDNERDIVADPGSRETVGA